MSPSVLFTEQLISSEWDFSVHPQHCYKKSYLSFICNIKRFNSHFVQEPKWLLNESFGFGPKPVVLFTVHTVGRLLSHCNTIVWIYRMNFTLIHNCIRKGQNCYLSNELKLGFSESNHKLNTATLLQFQPQVHRMY